MLSVNNRLPEPMLTQIYGIYAYVNWVIIGSGISMAPNRWQAITWTNEDLLSIGPLQTNFREILIEIQTFFHSRQHIWKYYLQNGSHFVSASICWEMIHKLKYSRPTQETTKFFSQFLRARVLTSALKIAEILNCVFCSVISRQRKACQVYFVTYSETDITLYFNK